MKSRQRPNRWTMFWRGLRALLKLVIFVWEEYRVSFETNLYRTWKAEATIEVNLIWRIGEVKEITTYEVGLNDVPRDRYFESIP